MNKAISQFLLASAMMSGLSEFNEGTKASDKTQSRKSERSHPGTRKMYEGITNKVSQKVIDTPKDKLDRPTGAMTVNTRKTHRNDECPCGSKKKFKHCHLS